MDWTGYSSSNVRDHVAMAAFLPLSDDAVIKWGMLQGLKLGGLGPSAKRKRAMSRHSLAFLHGSYATDCSDCLRLERVRRVALLFLREGS
jgi:hypothetical protein